MEPVKSQVRVFENSDALCTRAAEEFTRVASEVAATGGRFSLALAGGTTPKGLYALLAREDAPFRGRIPWGRIHFFWGDERHVPPDHADSNYRMAHETLLSRVPVPGGNLHRIRGENPDPARAAADYERTLVEFFRPVPPDRPRFDLVLLGIGPDGHTASLFPGTGAVHEFERLVTAVRVEALRSDRISLTPAVINNSARIIFLVSGSKKAEALRMILEGEAPPDLYPARAIRPTRGSLLWLVDRDAAGQLSSV